MYVIMWDVFIYACKLGRDAYEYGDYVLHMKHTSGK